MCNVSGMLVAVMLENIELVLSFLSGVAVTYYASEIFVFLRDLRKALEALVFSLCPLGALVFRHAVFGLVYCLVVVGKLLLYIPPLSRAVHNMMKEKNPDFLIEFITWPSLSIISQCVTTNLFKRARQGANAINVSLHTTEGQPLKLLDRARPGRPLVVNVGSCS